MRVPLITNSSDFTRISGHVALARDFRQNVGSCSATNRNRVTNSSVASAPIIVRRSAAETLSLPAEVRNVIREVWQARELLEQLIARDLRIRYHQAVMGFAWALLMPVLIVISGTIVRFAIATVSGSNLNVEDVGATAVKGVAWAFVSGSLGIATQSLLANASLITKLNFPRETLPLASVTAQGVDSLVSGTAVALFLPFVGLDVSWALLWVLPLVLMLVLFIAALSLVLSCANLFFRDIKYIVQVLLSFGIFFTPVFFEPAMFGPVIGKLMMFNPLSPIFEGLRLVTMEGHNLAHPLIEMTTKGQPVLAWTPWYLVYSVVVTFICMLVGIRVFRRSAVLFAEYA